MILVKLGGSVITEKSQLRSFRKENVERLVDEIKSARKKIILVHGAGSFGHLLANEYSLQKGFISNNQIPGLAKVMVDVRELNLNVMKILEEKGIAAVSIPPSTSTRLNSGEIAYLDYDLFERFIELDTMPVTFGDVCLDKRQKFGICSGDQLMEKLASHFKPERAIFCTDVDGIFSSDPASNPDARLIEEIDRSILERIPKSSKYVDVTGGMFGKIERMVRIASRNCECLVINGNVPGRLKAALKGDTVKGTRVVGE
ncbi:MAG: isopentenyl phosphate kinase [Methanomassiliicoccales archaeon]|jgi:isopentenyl phosphate kinase|nr:isopentenyl phosphate kinase [Methanomassiliicoccales archaeon]